MVPIIKPSACFCFGLGYTAGFLMKKLQHQGWAVGGTVRDPEKQKKLLENGCSAYLLSPSHPIKNLSSLLQGYTHVLFSIPPDCHGHDPFLRDYQDAFREIGHLAWIGYLSATSVYGDQQGKWVDENTPPNPSTDRGHKRWSAEKEWWSLHRQSQLPIHVFRLSSIYGPGRNALANVLGGKAKLIDQPGQIFNRLHIDDIIQVLWASMRQPRSGAVYNLADDFPSSPAEVIRYACQLLGTEDLLPTSLDDPAISEMTRSFYQENKRVSNRLIKEELKVELLHPSYREGLEDLWIKMATASNHKET